MSGGAVGSEMVRVCSACGSENPEGHRFCWSCGSGLSAPAVERRKLATSVFCDLSGSTELAERVDAEAVYSLMSSYFDEARSALERHGGTVEKFVGDAVVGMFGVPEAHEDDALRACRAALEIQERVGRLNLELERRFGVVIAVRVGVNTGEVVAGDKARRDAFASGDAVVLGDAVNVAARLEQSAGPGEVLIGEQTYRLVREAVSVEPVELLELKGKGRPVAAYRLLEVTAAGAAPRRAGTPLVGRAEELALLERTFETVVSERRCRLVTVLGEAGAGKSRLAAELVVRIGPRARVVHGACLSYGEGITYWALGRVVRELAEIGDDQSEAEARGRLDDVLAGAPEALAVAEQLAQLLGIGGVATTPQELAWAVRRLLAKVADHQPLLVVVDDIQWAERALLELLAGLEAGLEGSPILVLCLARPELLERDPDWRVALRLEPLATDAVQSLLASLGAPEEVRAQLAATAAGNPLFAEELVAMLIDEGVIRQTEDGSWTLERTLEEIALPVGLNALLGARLDRLETQARDALERGAVEGELFHRGAVVELSAPEARPFVPGQLEALAYRDFVRPTTASFAGEVAFRFKHILVREAAYQATAKRLRAALHAQFVDWLEGYARDRIGEYEEILGYHLEQAYQYRTEVGLLGQETDALRDRAASVLVAAGRRAAERGDYHAAGNLFERALIAGITDPPTRVAIKAELGNVLKETGRESDGNALLHETHDEAKKIGEHGTAALALVYRHTNNSDPNTDLEEIAVACARAVETFAELGDERGLALAHRQLGHALRRLDRRAEGMQELERSVVHAEACGDVAVRRRVIGSYAAKLGESRPAIEAIERCEELLAAAQADRVLEAVLKRFLGCFCAMAGRADEALALFDESSFVLDDLNNFVYWMYRAGVAWGRVLAGDPIGAEQEMLTRYSYYKGLGHNGTRMDVIGSAYALAEFYCDQGRWDEAERLVARYRELSLDAQAAVDLARRRRGLEARLAAHDGRTEEALSLVERMRPRGIDAQFPNQAAATWLVVAEVQRAAGYAAEAKAARETALELYRLSGNVAAADRVLAATG